jgi:hypothetical protein
MEKDDIEFDKIEMFVCDIEGERVEGLAEKRMVAEKVLRFGLMRDWRVAFGLISYVYHFCYL